MDTFANTVKLQSYEFDEWKDIWKKQGGQVKKLGGDYAGVKPNKPSVAEWKYYSLDMELMTDLTTKQVFDILRKR